MQTEELAQKIQEYDAAFDFYMEQGQLPDTLSEDDLLGGFIGQTIDDNPQLASQDPLWQEMLKEEVMNFIKMMLEVFQPIERQYQEEMMLISLFVNGDIHQKRNLWRQASGIISNKYTPEEVNLEGYNQQFKDDKIDNETILDTLSKDWENACKEQKDKKEKEMLKRWQQQWERDLKEHGLSDYKSRKRIEKMFYSYPILREIVQLIGREQPQRDDEMDETIRRYLPILPSPPVPAAEAEEISNSSDLQHLLPSETAILSDPQTEALFYFKYATSKLQTFANRPKTESQLKTEQRKKKRPRLEKGPIIVSMDTSGSMQGKPEKVARSLLYQLLRMAKRQKRKCFLITFSIHAQCLDLTVSGAWSRLDSFLKDCFTGGTCGDEMLKAAIDMLHSKTFSMADVLIISDFYFPNPDQAILWRMSNERAKGTKFYGLRINSDSDVYDDILDKIWQV